MSPTPLSSKSSHSHKEKPTRRKVYRSKYHPVPSSELWFLTFLCILSATLTVAVPELMMAVGLLFLCYFLIQGIHIRLGCVPITGLVLYLLYQVTVDPSIILAILGVALFFAIYWGLQSIGNRKKEKSPDILSQNYTFVLLLVLVLSISISLVFHNPAFTALGLGLVALRLLIRYTIVKQTQQQTQVQQDLDMDKDDLDIDGSEDDDKLLVSVATTAIIFMLTGGFFGGG